jgi:hypothetical protein
MTEQKKKLSPAPSPSQIDINLGFKATRNFSSLSCNIGITDFVRAEETLDEAVERVYSYVERKVVEKLESVKKELEEVYDGKK